MNARKGNEGEARKRLAFTPASLLAHVPVNLTVADAIELHRKVCGICERHGCTSSSTWRTICGNALLAVARARAATTTDALVKLHHIAGART